MTKEFIPYKQAIELKELGLVGSITKGLFLPPTFSQVFRFFREKHNLHFYAHEYELIPAENSDEYPINVWLARIDKANYIQQFDTYEEAEIACLKKLIEIVKQPKKD